MRFYVMTRSHQYYPKVQVNLSADPARPGPRHDSVSRRFPSYEAAVSRLIGSDA